MIIDENSGIGWDVASMFGSVKKGTKFTQLLAPNGTACSPRLTEKKNFDCTKLLCIQIRVIIDDQSQRCYD